MAPLRPAPPARRVAARRALQLVEQPSVRSAVLAEAFAEQWSDRVAAEAARAQAEDEAAQAQAALAKKDEELAAVLARLAIHEGSSHTGPAAEAPAGALALVAQP